MLICLFILLLGISPAILYWGLRRQIETHAIAPLSAPGGGWGLAQWRRPDLPADAVYVEGVGYVIGDLSCQYNARSSYIRCAVNPGGPCEGCRFYQSKGGLEGESGV